MRQIEALLRREIGLDAASIGSSLIERTIRRRARELGLQNSEDYHLRLLESRFELDELIEAVVVTETWFFRDRGPFDAFAQLVRARWHTPAAAERQHGEHLRDGKLRILSVPCSSGEEPYSVAMTLLDAKIPPENFVIDAVDISIHALSRARKAVYGKNSFRAKDLTFRDRYFHQVKEGHALNTEVKRCVNFHRENALDEEFLSGQRPYHYIFCRNLLIYFDRITQLRTLEKLSGLLKPDGVLFVGSAELPLVTESGFENVNLPMAFACRKTNPGKGSSKPKLQTPIKVHASKSGKAADRGQENMDSKSGTEDAKQILQAVRRLADSGQLAQAAALCETHIVVHGPNAEAYYLLGLVKDVASDPKAATFYRKAIYLEPNHREALAHMALWLEKNGDAEGARTFKRRAERAEGKNNSK